MTKGDDCVSEVGGSRGQRTRSPEQPARVPSLTQLRSARTPRTTTCGRTPCPASRSSCPAAAPGMSSR